ncbi:hypothetical protein ILYODFUR_025451 [Ilyodon furcidens]|uniref:Uncharacterized protein n=1 Tax=Ilyodon furcidens TaxID=33524 RepID=A0ABV0V610_9TELE
MTLFPLAVYLLCSCLATETTLLTFPPVPPNSLTMLVVVKPLLSQVTAAENTMTCKSIYTLNIFASCHVTNTNIDQPKKVYICEMEGKCYSLQLYSASVTLIPLNKIQCNQLGPFLSTAAHLCAIKVFFEGLTGLLENISKQTAS